jgi:hypothetical protein
MSVDRLSNEAVQKVSGPAWEPLREAFFAISRTLLNVNSETAGVLATIYVKYQTSSAASSDVYAVAWLKTSKQIVVGLALPESVESDVLGPSPKGMFYRGITKYLTIKPGDQIPAELTSWAEAAYQSVVAKSEG